VFAAATDAKPQTLANILKKYRMNNEILVDYTNKKTRFLNLVIDSICFWILWIIHVLLFEDFIKNIIGEGSAMKNIAYLLTFYFMYNFVFELLFGKTIGKFLTGTKVVDNDEKKPTFKTLLIRNLCRLIPFDAFSYLIFETGWHDSISKTTVVNT
jgi:uncharacterized RDD family membrane protein YckC